MSYDDIKGNEAVKEALDGMLSSGRIPHAILFHEDDGGGALVLCHAFLDKLMGPRVSRLLHMDVHYAYPISGKMTDDYARAWRELLLSNPFFTEQEMNEALGIDAKQSLIAVPEAKEILRILGLNALEGGYRAVIIYLPEKMNADAANRMLKSIEEPDPKTIFLLVTHAPERVLTTVSSRCLHIRVMPDPKTEENEYIAGELERFRGLMDALLSGDLSAALAAADGLAAIPSRDKAKAFCRFASEALRAVFVIQQGMPELARVSPSVGQYCRELAGRCRKSFPRTASAVLDRTHMMIERNVNMKILFTDMVDRMYLMIQK